MPTNDYHFIDRWRVEDDLKELADVLDDARSLSLKPIFRSNHNWTMNRGEASLRLEFQRRRAKSPKELSLVPPGPSASLVIRALNLNR